jgi:hypothetical protein
VRQSRGNALVESLTNIVAGVGINFAANLAILPALGFTALTLKTNLVLCAFFTAVSLVRSYSLRRLFDHLLHRTR